MLRQFISFKVIFLFSVFMSFGFIAADHHEEMTLYETINETEELGAFSNLVADSGMDRFLHHEGPYTVLAPNNEAFDELPQEVLNEVFNNIEMQQDVLQNHIFQGEHSSDEIAHVVEGEILDEINTTNGTIIVIDEIIN